MAWSIQQIALIGAALAIAVAGGYSLLTKAPEPTLNSVGPGFGAGPAIYLFQSYECNDCWNATVAREHESWRQAAQEYGFTIVWKNTAPDTTNAAIASHCVWQQFPTRWHEWNTAAFEGQLEPGAGWGSMDRVLYLTETTLLLAQDDTRTFEACLTSGQFDEQVKQDTRFAEQAPALPALYANGKWHPANIESIANLAAGT